MRKLTNPELRAAAEDRVKKGLKRKDIYLVLDNLRSVYNIGAIFRSADAAGVKKIYLCGICAHPPRPDLHKTALGTEDYMDWEYCEKTIDAVNKLKKDKVKIVALELTDQSVDFRSLDNTETLAIVVGNEVDGISDEVLEACDLAVDIPMAGWANSINVATSAAVILFSLID